jgi:hypothetical protein
MLFIFNEAGIYRLSVLKHLGLFLGANRAYVCRLSVLKHFIKQIKQH